MGWTKRVLGVAGVLLMQGVGCSPEAPRREPPPVKAPPSTDVGTPGGQAPPTSEEEPPAPDDDTEPAPEDEPPASDGALSCEDIRPEALGLARSVVLAANGPEADCGPGMGDGTGALALMNSGRFGATAWNVVTREGEDTGNRMLGGDVALSLLPQTSGFHLVRIPPGGASLTAHDSDGTLLQTVTLTGDDDEPLSVAVNPRGGTLVARWAPRDGGVQVLSVQRFDEAGQALGAPTELLSAPQDEVRFVVAGVDVRGRALVLWPESGSATWGGQWLRRNGKPLTGPFSFPAPTSASGGGLFPLVGGGLALRSDGQWISRFPSGREVVRPAPEWLASQPGTELVLIRENRAYALVPPPTFLAGSGCQESIRFFARNGTACGELLLPVDGSTCFRRQLGIGRDGTVIQQRDVSATTTSQCSWRWWPGLLE